MVHGPEYYIPYTPGMGERAGGVSARTAEEGG